MPAASDLPSLPSLPAVVEGSVSHRRTAPLHHAFRYRVYLWLVDLDAIPRMPWYLRPFASFHSADHLGDPARSIRENVAHFLSLHGVDLGPDGRIVMLANARVLGHVFDPLSVFWCFDGDGRPVCVVAEVHNTYGERHAYLLRPDESGRATTDKGFYVSPFHDVSGSYELRFALTRSQVATVVRLVRDGAPTFSASFHGTPAPATPARLAWRVLRRPLMTYRVSMLSRWHGIRLWLRGLRVRTRPNKEPQEGV